MTRCSRFFCLQNKKKNKVLVINESICHHCSDAFGTLEYSPFNRNILSDDSTKVILDLPVILKVTPFPQGKGQLPSAKFFLLNFNFKALTRQLLDFDTEEDGESLMKLKISGTTLAVVFNQNKDLNRHFKQL